jgi:hypothetical protein
VVAAWIGHTDASLTMRRYVHSQDDALKAAGDTFNPGCDIVVTAGRNGARSNGIALVTVETMTAIEPAFPAWGVDSSFERALRIAWLDSPPANSNSGYKSGFDTPGERIRYGACTAPVRSGRGYQRGIGDHRFAKFPPTLRRVVIVQFLRSNRLAVFGVTLTLTPRRSRKVPTRGTCYVLTNS